MSFFALITHPYVGLGHPIGNGSHLTGCFNHHPLLMSGRFGSPRIPSPASLTWRAAQLLGGAILFKDYIAEAAICAGESMLPTLRSNGDVLLVEKVSTTFRLIKRGDVVVCVSPSDPDKLICKRVIGLVSRIVIGTLNT